MEEPLLMGVLKNFGTYALEVLIECEWLMHAYIYVCNSKRHSYASIFEIRIYSAHKRDDEQSRIRYNLYVLVCSSFYSIRNF